jgi:hypothetical protein
VELVSADVERDDSGRAVLEKAVREPAGRGSDIEAPLAGDVDGEGGQGRLELLPAARDELRRPLDHELGGLVDLLARLRVAVDEPGEDQRLRLPATLREAALDEHHVQPLLHLGYDVRTASPVTMSERVEVSAGISTSIASARSPASFASARAPSAPSLRTYPSESRMSSTI